MNIIGSGILRIDLKEKQNYFEDLYKKSFWQDIVDLELNTKHYTIRDKIAHIVYLEYDGQINQSFSLTEDDHLIIYSENLCKGVFNTEQRAYMRLMKSDKFETVAMWCFENSPYNVPFNELKDETGITGKNLLINLNQNLESHSLKPDATKNNTIFVRML